MNQVFRTFIRKFVLVLFNDILVYSQTKNKHLEHLRNVLETLAEHKLEVKLSKYKFATKKRLSTEAMWYQKKELGHILPK